MLELFGITITYELLTALLILFVDVVIFFITLFRKNKKILDVYGLIDNCLPFYIHRAEEQYPVGFGEIKKELVIKAVYGTLLDNFKNIKVERYKDYIEKSLERILSTPQKKGDSIGG